MKNYVDNLIKVLERRCKYNDKLQFVREYNKAFDKALAENERCKQINEFIIHDYSPYFRGWFMHKGIHKEYDSIMYEMTLDYLKDDNAKEVKNSKVYPKYKEIQEQIIQDMRENPKKYETDSGDIEW